MSIVYTAVLVVEVFVNNQYRCTFECFVSAYNLLEEIQSIAMELRMKLRSAALI